MSNEPESMGEMLTRRDASHGGFSYGPREQNMIRLNFEPLPDITAYELAQIISRVVFPTGDFLAHTGVTIALSDYHGMHNSIRRHFVAVAVS